MNFVNRLKGFYKYKLLCKVNNKNINKLKHSDSI